MSNGSKGRFSKAFVWIILALLVVGLVGFGTRNFGTSAGAVARVGETEVSASDYARELNQELRALSAQTGQNITLDQAQQIGVDRAVLQRLIAQAALDNETSRVGLSAGDERILEELVRIQGFSNANGSFDRAAYESAIQRAGMTTNEFEESVRNEISRTLFQGAIANGVSSNKVFSTTLMDFIGEKRAFTYARIDAEALPETAEPATQEELEAYYIAHPDKFTAPEIKRISYAWLLPEFLVDQIDINEADLRGLYDERIDEFQRPERRLVERLVFPSEGEAIAAKEKLDSGEVTFEDLVAGRGLQLSDVDMGDVRISDLGFAGQPVFQMTEPGTIGPLDTDLGPAIFRMNAILSAENTSFEEASESLSEELALDAARRQIVDQTDEISDLLAGGATIEELAKDQGMDLDRIDWFENYSERIASYGSFGPAAAALQQGDFPVVNELDDGGIYVMRLDEIIPPTLQPFEEVAEEVERLWMGETTDKLVHELAASFASRASEGQKLDSMGLNLVTDPGQPRNGFVAGTPEDFLTTLFEMEKPGQTAIVDGFGASFLVQLDEVIAVDHTTPQSITAMEQLEASSERALSQDVLEAFTAKLQSQSGIEIDNATLNAVHTQFP